MFARYVEEWCHTCIINHLNMSALTLACSDCNITIFLFAACEVSDVTPKNYAFFSQPIVDRSTASAAVLVELISYIYYLENFLLTMLVDLVVLCNQSTNLVNAFQEVGASTLIHDSDHRDSSILSAYGDSIRAFDSNFCDKTTFDLLKIEYALVEAILGEDFQLLLFLSLFVICLAVT